MHSDPALDVREIPPSRSPVVPERSLLPQAVGRAAATRQRRWRLAGFAAVSVAAVLVTLQVLISAIAAPLTTDDAADAPVWSVEVTSASTSPVIAVIYGREAGFHVVRVPSNSAPQNAARIIPARIAKGELHMMSLGWASLRARASSPNRSRPMTWFAQGRAITAFENSDGTGVRTSW